MEKPLPATRRHSTNATTTEPPPLGGVKNLLSQSRRHSTAEYRRLSRSRVSFDTGRNREPDKAIQEEEKQKAAAAVPNTFQLEPECQFPVDRATDIIKNTMHKALDGVDYDAKTCSRLCTSLADQVKAEIRQLRIPRYKLVSSCCIGDLTCQGLRVASRCAWDNDRDNYASYTYQNKTLFATATVYAVYFS